MGPKRTAKQQAKEAAIRSRHAANPVRSKPANTINQKSFTAILAFKTIRKEMGLTLAEVAERMGIDAPTLSRLETGNMLNPTLAMLHKWAEGLDAQLEMNVSSG